MSSPYYFYKKIILIIAIIAIVIAVFVFFINRSVVWQINENNIKINNIPEQEIKVFTINNNSDINNLTRQIEEFKVSDNIEFQILAGILDRFVLTGKKLNKIFKDYKQRGVDLNKLEKQLTGYYSFVEVSIEILNKLEWQQTYKDANFKLYNHEKLKQEMFVNLQTALENLKNIFVYLENIIVITSDKPFQCGLPETRAVYNCEENSRKVILLNGFDFYDLNSEKINNINQNIKCFEDINLCD